MRFVGIDIASEQHVAAVVDESGEVTHRPTGFGEDAAGYGRLLELAGPRLPFLTQSAEILGQAVTRPQIPLYPRVWTQLQAMLEAVLTGRLDPAAATAHAAVLIEAITGLPIVREPVAVPV